MPPFATPIGLLLARAAVAAGLLAAIPAAATEYTVFGSVWLQPRAADPAAPKAVPALLSMPPGWAAGDAAAVVISDPAHPGGPRDLLVARLLGDGAAVLELDVFSPRGFSADSGANPAMPSDAALVPDLLAALAELRRTHAAGIVIAVGFGAGGGAALDAARTVAAGGFAAGIDMGADGQPAAIRYAAGPAPPPSEAWGMRVAALCDVLGAPGRGCVDALSRHGDGALGRLGGDALRRRLGG